MTALSVRGHAPGSSRWLLLAMTGGAALQVAILLQRGAALPEALWLSALLALTMIAAWHFRSVWLRVVGVTGAIGGAGMLVGLVLDVRGGALQPSCHALTLAEPLNVVSWMNGLMWLTCVPACVWSCRSCGRQGGGVVRHGLCAAMMFGGMVLGGRWLTPLLGDKLSWLGANHVAMLLGMMAGAAIAHLPFRALWGRVIIRVPMPSEVPEGGADLRLGFQRIPPRSCILQPAVKDAHGAVLAKLRELTLYGRGEGSNAQERAYVSVPLDASALARLTPNPASIELRVLELDGSPVSEAGFLDLVEHELVPRG